MLICLMAALGLVAVGIALRLPWLDSEFHLGPVVRVGMALSGAAILIIAGWPGATRSGAIRRVVTLLGLTVLIYPTLLSLAAAGLGGRAIQLLAGGGHVVPLVVVQLLPVLASQVATGRSRRRWLVLILTVAVVGLIATILVLQEIPGASVLGAISSVLWFGSFVLAPIATWTNVRGSIGDARRRAIVAGLGSVIPVVIIACCLTLGAAAEIQGLSESASVTALMAGFSLATLGSTTLAVAATGPSESALLRRRLILWLLAALLVASTGLVALACSLGLLAYGLGSATAAVSGVVVAVGVGLGAVQLFHWATRAVDPIAELQHELDVLGPAADGAQRQVLQQALRRTVGDPGLLLIVQAADGVWVGSNDDLVDVLPERACVLASSSNGPVAALVGSLPNVQGWVDRLGDCDAVVRPAVLEATALRESSRADSAARDERARLTQDLHDGLQGRLLGIALNLQLSGRELADPTARLLVEQTVVSLRDAVEDVRTLAGGRLPATLVDAGLWPALADLVRPLATVVDLRVPDVRFPPEVEATSYFVVGEAVSNAIKHGRAERIVVSVDQAEGRLTILVSDDGVGGADPRLGSGLRGLSERVAASGGVLVVRPGDRAGTVVEASLPCGS